MRESIIFLNKNSTKDFNGFDGFDGDITMRYNLSEKFCTTKDEKIQTILSLTDS